jgi:hypothetical protein
MWLVTENVISKEKLYERASLGNNGKYLRSLCFGKKIVLLDE